MWLRKKRIPVHVVICLVIYCLFTSILQNRKSCLPVLYKVHQMAPIRIKPMVLSTMRLHLHSKNTPRMKNIMNVVKDTKLVRSNAMSGTLTAATKSECQVWRTYKLYLFHSTCVYPENQYVGEMQLWATLNHKTHIKMPCHWNCVFWEFKFNAMVITPHFFIWLPFYFPSSYKMFLIEAPHFSNLYLLCDYLKNPYLSDSYDLHANIMDKESGQVKKTITKWRILQWHHVETEVNWSNSISNGSKSDGQSVTDTVPSLECKQNAWL